MSIDENLTQDLGWRENELAVLKAIALSTEEFSDQRKAMLRALWALLYAHYEGFFKFTWDCLLEQIANNSPSRKELLPSLETLSLESTFKRMRKDLSTPSLISFFNGFQGNYDNPVKFDIALDTESNLYPNLIDTNNNVLNIELTSLNNYRAHLRALVSRRNEIAHGKAMVIKDLEQYTEYENAAITVMHELAEKSIEYIKNKNYLMAEFR